MSACSCCMFGGSASKDQQRKKDVVVNLTKLTKSKEKSVQSTNCNDIMCKLREGNDRFLKKDTDADYVDYLLEVVEHTKPDWRSTLVDGQKPVATILTCSDSRVSPEFIFNAGLGEVFIVRNAGNTWDTSILATIEYGIVHLGTPVCVVMGHENCGAIKAAMDHYNSLPKGASAPPGSTDSPGAKSTENGKGPEKKNPAPAEDEPVDFLGQLIGKLVPAVETAARQVVAETGTEDWHGNAEAKLAVQQRAIIQNVKNTKQNILDKLPKVRSKVEKGEVAFMLGVYNLTSGKVQIIDQ